MIGLNCLNSFIQIILRVCALQRVSVAAALIISALTITISSSRSRSAIINVSPQLFYGLRICQERVLTFILTFSLIVIPIFCVSKATASSFLAILSRVTISEISTLRPSSPSTSPATRAASASTLTLSFKPSLRSPFGTTITRPLTFFITQLFYPTNSFILSSKSAFRSSLSLPRSSLPLASTLFWLSWS